MFAVCGLPKVGGLGFTFKCSDLSYQLLIEQRGCRTAPYFKNPWIQCFTQEILDDATLKLYLGASYNLIFAKLSKKLQLALT